MKSDTFLRKPLPVRAFKYISWTDLLSFLGPSVTAEHSDNYVTLRRPDQTLVLRPGDWIVIPSNGPLEVHDDLTFHAVFEKPSEPSAKPAPAPSAPSKPLRNKK